MYSVHCTVESPCATGSRKRPPPISNHLSKTPNFPSQSLIHVVRTSRKRPLLVSPSWNVELFIWPNLILSIKYMRSRARWCFFLQAARGEHSKGRGEHSYLIFPRGSFANVSDLGPVSRKSRYLFGPEKWLYAFTVLGFTIKVSIIENDTMKSNYQLTKQNWLVMSKKICHYSVGFKFKVRSRARKVTGPWAPFLKVVVTCPVLYGRSWLPAKLPGNQKLIK